jgi:hypothetical protein
MSEDKPIKLSPSSLNLYLECPRCFWLHQNRGIKRPSGIFPSLPGGMDGILKVYFNEYRGTGTLPPIIEGKVQGDLMNSLPASLFYKDETNQAVLWGKLDDALDFGDGTFAPLDHKTRGYPPKDEILAPYQLQMDVYDLLMQANAMLTKNLAYLVYYYPTTGQLHNDFPFEVVVKEVKSNPERAKRVFEGALDLLRNDEMPVASKTCAYCGWANAMNNLED